MMSLNRTTIIGNLGKDAELIQTENGTFVSFTVAWNELYTDKSGTKREVTEWYQCTYNRVAIAQYLKKGMRVEVEGRMGTEAYLTKNKEAAARLTLWVNRIELLSDKKVGEPTKVDQEDTIGEPTM